jgi:hypothetical protein
MEGDLRSVILEPVYAREPLSSRACAGSTSAGRRGEQMEVDHGQKGSPAGAVRKDRPGGGKLRVTLRIVTSLQVLAIIMQAVTAGQILNGADGATGVHGAGAGAVHLLGVIQVIVAVLYWKPGRGTGWAAVTSLVLLVAGFAQSAMGDSHNLAVHIPLGVGLLALATTIAVWAWAIAGTTRAART